MIGSAYGAKTALASPTPKTTQSTDDNSAVMARGMGSQTHHTTVQLRMAASTWALGLNDGMSTEYRARATSGPRNSPIVFLHRSKVCSRSETVSFSSMNGSVVVLMI